jgi:hypothetical protein
MMTALGAAVTDARPGKTSDAHTPEIDLDHPF